jgi:dTDP-4-dehydrorhamnose reductase
MTRVLILGITSWIGFRLAERLHAQPGDWQVSGTSRNMAVVPGLHAELHRAADEPDFQRVLEIAQPAIVINLLRGEDAAGMAVHRAILEWCVGHAALYCYASSALALDGYEGVPLTEDLPARSISSYGQFKQACEAQLQARPGCHHLILRFASIQGWVPHKATRNEVFLRKLAAGQEVTVDRGVLQNRILDRTLAAAVVDLLAADATGVVHLGAADASEEFTFLQRVAEAFSYDPARVKSGASREVNLVVQPHRLYELFGDRYRVTEAQAVRALLDYEGLRRCVGLAPAGLS